MIYTNSWVIYINSEALAKGTVSPGWIAASKNFSVLCMRFIRHIYERVDAGVGPSNNPNSALTGQGLGYVWVEEGYSRAQKEYHAR